MNINDNKECAFCGDDFSPRRSDAKFCSESCKQKAYLSRKQAEVDDLKEQVFENNRKTTDNDDAASGRLVVENDTDNRHLTPDLTRQLTDKKETDSRKMTDNLRIKDTAKPAFHTPVRSQFTDADKEDPNPHRMIDVTIGGKQFTVMKSAYEFFGEEYYKNCELFASEEEYEKAEKNKAMEKAKAFWSFSDKEKVARINKELRVWIKTLLIFKGGVKLREVKVLLNKILAFMKSSDYVFIPKGYCYKDFIETTFLPKIKRLIISMETNGNRYVQLVMDETYQKQLEEILVETLTS